MSKTILITGSTDGIGKLAAIKLANEGHKIIVHGRNSTKLAVTVAEVKSLSNNPKIYGIEADFSKSDSVKKMISILSDMESLDVLINNAGIFNSPENTAALDIDIRFVVNYLAPYMLTNSLLPILRKSPAPRIINVGSAAQSPVNLEALSGKEDLTVNQAYAQSKLALTMWAFNMAKQVDFPVIAVNPGSLLNTKMAIEAYGQHWAPAEKGANIIYELAVLSKYKSDSGKYFDNDLGDEIGHFSSAHVDAYDNDKIAALIEKTEEIIQKF